ncbi:uncharacterized protein LOC122030364 [Zingiber officinale]|uniref:UspA domain-containing protein n=1 Tax=Zingiber officinale TaxID=94328 RepID=A0A8J5EUB0_ZINOF|nr:uncharacterized protein LOC122030364 [Zingiber officinale]KAG6472416.1 hypothetical protein ZIOFF_069878 [Zingiber officinale]
MGNGGEDRGSKRWDRRKEEDAIGYWCGESAAMVANKRVMVVVDQSGRSKHAMKCALTHLVNKGDLLTLLHVVPPNPRRYLRSSVAGAGAGHDIPTLANSLGALCKACKPEVEVEALVIKGPKLATVLSQVRKLEVSALVLSQGKPSPLCCLIRSSSEEFVEECISNAECLTLAVRKQSRGVGGYLLNSRWHKNFWLLA